MVRRRRKQGAGESVAIIILLILVLGVISALEWRVGAFIAIGLVPTAVLASTGRGQWHGHRVQTVGAMNLVGITPYALKLWSVPSQFELMTSNLVTWMVVWGAASIGYMLLYIGPFVASVIVQQLNKERLKTVAKQRQALIEEWGPEVAKVDEPKKPAEAGKFIPRKN